MMPENFIRTVFQDAGMPLTEQQMQAFLRYYELLMQRNRVMNLTAITGFQEAAVRHFADSCMLFSPALSEARIQAGITEQARVIDVGTGAGFPGIPLKIWMSGLSVVLLDALQKRVDFLQDVITTLDLNRIFAIHARAEEGVLLRWDHVPVDTSGDTAAAVFLNHLQAGEAILRETFDLAISRAVAHLAVLSEYCLPYVRVGGCFAAYKSGNIDTEMKEAENAWKILGGELVSDVRFTLPHLGDARSILLIRKVRETPLKYPRKAGKPGKNPL